MSVTKHSHARHVAPVGYVDLNANQSTSATPATQTPIDWARFFDSDQVNVGSLPAVLGLIYTAGVFEAVEAGIWIINLGVELVAAPGATGTLLLSIPNYGYAPSIDLAASGNVGPWVVNGHAIVMNVGDTFSLTQVSSGSSIDLIDGYAAMDIVQIAGGVT